MSTVLDRPAARPEDALRPDRTVWVAASAGAGKTTTLTRRVLSLLMHGCKPGRILCLTFTKAAAAEMALRVNAQLAAWSRAGDAELKADLKGLLGRAPGAAELRRAKGLFGHVLDVPGGMKIQTIHAFCQSLLRRFPIEAGLPPYFEVMDERASLEAILAAREDILGLARAADGSDDPRAAEVAAALSIITAQVQEDAFNELMGELARQRGRLRRLILAHDKDGRSADGACAAIRARLGLKDGETYNSLLADGCADGAFDADGLKRAGGLLATGTATDRKNAATMADIHAAPAAARVESFELYCKAFLTQKGEPSKKLISKIVAGDAVAAAALQAEADRLVRLRERLRAARLAESSAAVVRLGAALLRSYETHKLRRALLDYEDLILRARDLLRGEGELARNAAAWVLFKLDGGLDHILVDEAQDTSPEQWEVVAALAEEFFAGEGAHEAPRTVFVVGDLKQSIYSFQGADPDAFLRMRVHFRDKAEAARHSWLELPQDVSYRSTAAVLQAVDATFAAPTAADGVADGAKPILHVARRLGQGGVVELWPAVTPEVPAPAEPWQPPRDIVANRDPAARLAAVIAARVKCWLADGERLPSRGRELCPGDVMVLVRRRTAFVDALVRGLKGEGVPVAGADRLVLTEQLAVMDLVAFGQFLLLPSDDLTLAVVLKSPLVGMSETQLFELAHGRDCSLWRTLKRRAALPDAEPGAPNAVFRAAHDMLARYLGRVDYLRPYELYSELLGRDGGRRRLLGRLGVDADDPIAEFLGLDLAYERQATPSLQGFLHWFVSGQAEIKRDLEQGVRDEVRIMTVHGAKGLQAPVVILPDTMRIPTQQPTLLWAPHAEAEGERIDALRLPLWSLRGADDDAICAAERRAAQNRQSQEYRRLLYVALTRAEDRLYVCGWQGRNAPPTDCWYNLVRDGLQRLAGQGLAKPVALDFAGLCADGWSGAGLRLECDQVNAPDKAEGAANARSPAETPLPDWALRPARPEPKPWRPLAPSRPDPEDEFDPPLLSPFADDGLRFKRGILIHRLLQTLPDLAPASRPDAAKRYLARPTWALTEAQQARIAEETMRVLTDPRFAALFGDGSRAEVAIAGRLGDDVINGQIDRLVTLADRVLVVDYKSNRPAPTRLEDVPRLYLKQLAAYKGLLAGVYPGRRIECALLWTDGPHWMELPAELLAPHIPSERT